MQIKPADLEATVLVAKAKGYFDIFAEVERQFRFPEFLLAAVASRETNLKHVNGDGGHGRGIMQIDDRYHGNFLREHGAEAPEFVPPLYCSVHYAGRLLHSHVLSARQLGVRAAFTVIFIAAAYNAGLGGATNGWREGNTDKYTAGGNYGKDVVARRLWLVKNAERLGLRPV